MGRPKDQDISTPLSQCVGRDISCTFRVGWPTELGHRIYPSPLQNGWAKIYHMPSKRVSRDISIPLPSGSAEIYPFPFTAGQPGYIICLQNGSARIYHM